MVTVSWCAITIICKPQPAPEPRLHFKDHFSAHSEDYARYRPTYPSAMFSWIAARAPATQRAWDCACGSGQASVQLARHFGEVIATDASARQIGAAIGPANVRFAVAGAVHSGLGDDSVDAVCVAQALHWFDAGAFYGEAQRVARPGAILAVWMYGLPTIAGQSLLADFYHDTVGSFWPAERARIDNGYADVRLPGSELKVPAWRMTAHWPLAHLLGYVGSWSAVRRYRAATGADPLKVLSATLTARWGDPEVKREVCWPLVVRATRL